MLEVTDFKQSVSMTLNDVTFGILILTLRNNFELALDTTTNPFPKLFRTVLFVIK